MKKQTFLYSFHNYSLGEAGLTGCTDIVNLDVTDGGSAGRRRQTQLVLYVAIDPI